MNKIILIAIILALSTNVYAQDDYIEWCMKSCLPTWIHHSIKALNLDAEYEISFHINPYYQRGDFDGDGKPDYAVSIFEKASNKKGIMIIHYPGNESYIFGAGKAFGNGGDDFKWMLIWKVLSGDTLNSIWGTNEVTLVGEALLCEKPESASGYIFWDGEEYNWYQGSD